MTRLNPAGNDLVYSTYFGGSGEDRSLGIAVDAQGGAYITGKTASTNFPTRTPFQTANGGGTFDAFVTKISNGIIINTTQNRLTDFDGDGKSDLAVFRPSTNIWYLLRSTSGFAATQFWQSGDKLTAADFDGDNKTDIAVWRETAANPDQSFYYIFQSSTNTVVASQFGRTGDNSALTGDWDGDGKADVAVYRNVAFGSQSYFFYRGSLNNPSGTITYVPWGTDGDKAVRGDFDGDGKLDAAVYRPSTNTYYIRQSSNGKVIYRTFGIAGDKIVNGDFDGDGKDDTAVFRPSNGVWYIWQSSNNQVRYQQFRFGNGHARPSRLRRRRQNRHRRQSQRNLVHSPKLGRPDHLSQLWHNRRCPCRIGVHSVIRLTECKPVAVCTPLSGPFTNGW